MKKQIDRSKEAINRGEWTLNDIFGNRKEKPSKISTIILTWWDIINPNIGTEDEDILSCNFRTFTYLYQKSKGNMDELIYLIKGLSKVFCPSRLVKNTEYYDGKKIDYIREVQTDILPPLSAMKSKELSKIILGELETLAHFPEDWRDQSLKINDDPDLWCFD